jgi:hypothetical protein
MGEDWPKIKARHTRRVSPWMAIIEREVEFAPGAECDLPCGQPAGLHRHRRSVTGSPPSYRPAIPPGVGELYLGIACRANRSRRGCGRVLPPRTHGGDGFCRPRRARVRVLCALYGALVQSGPFILCRDRFQCRAQTNRTGNRTQAGKSRELCQFTIPNQELPPLSLRALGRDHNLALIFDRTCGRTSCCSAVLSNSEKSCRLVCFYNDAFFVHPYALVDPELGAFDQRRVLAGLQQAGADEQKLCATSAFLSGLEDFDAAYATSSKCHAYLERLSHGLRSPSK